MVTISKIIICILTHTVHLHSLDNFPFITASILTLSRLQKRMSPFQSLQHNDYEVSVLSLILRLNLSNRTLNKTKFCINRTLNKVPMLAIFLKITCRNIIPVYSEQTVYPKEVRLIHV